MTQHRTPRLLGTLLLVAAAGFSLAGAEASAADRTATPLGRVVPAPASVDAGGSPYRITDATRIRVDDSPETRRVGAYLAGILRPSTGFSLPVTSQGTGGIRLRLGAGSGSGSGAGSLGAEGYRLDSGRDGVTITAGKAAGLFHGVQTLRQLLPAAVERNSVQPGPWLVAGGTIKDTPRYGYRGAMLDVSRHFFTVAQVKRYIDELALYKVNKLHLHLGDDQGWRIAIDSWPRLATYGGSTQVGEARAVSTPRPTTGRSCGTPPPAIWRSSRRSTCRGTPTPRSPRTPS